MSLLTLYSMIKVWNQVFWKPAPEGVPEPQKGDSNWYLQVIPAVTLTLLILALGLFAEPVYRLAQAAAGQILTPQAYIQVVLGGGY
jgi:multicomponent Na+:H+ antiporter subunit D